MYNRKAPLMYGEFFFGINISFIKSFKSINYQSIAMIMKQTYFKGLPGDNTTRNKTPMTKIKVSITSADEVKKMFLEDANALIIQNDMYSKFLNETKDVIEKFVNSKYANETKNNLRNTIRITRNINYKKTRSILCYNNSKSQWNVLHHQ